MSDWQAADGNPYPHKFHVTLSMPEYVQKFESLGSGEQLKGSSVSVAGALAVARQRDSIWATDRVISGSTNIIRACRGVGDHSIPLPGFLDLYGTIS